MRMNISPIKITESRVQVYQVNILSSKLFSISSAYSGSLPNFLFKGGHCIDSLHDCNVILPFVLCWKMSYYFYCRRKNILLKLCFLSSLSMVRRVLYIIKRKTLSTIFFGQYTCSLSKSF